MFCQNHAAIADASENLARSKAEESRIAECPDPLLPVVCSKGQGGILDEEKTMLLCDCEQGVHARREAIHMHCHYCHRCRSDCCLDCFGTEVEGASLKVRQ